MTKGTEKVVNVPKKKVSIEPKRGRTMKRTLRELETLGIQLCDVFSMESLSIQLSWDKLIKLLNYNAGKKVLNWDHTFEEALEMIKIFF